MKFGPFRPRILVGFKKPLILLTLRAGGVIVGLGLAIAGLNPFHTMRTAYSVWPVMLIPYSLPPLVMYEVNLIYFVNDHSCRKGYRE